MTGLLTAVLILGVCAVHLGLMPVCRHVAHHLTRSLR